MTTTENAMDTHADLSDEDREITEELDEFDGVYEQEIQDESSTLAVFDGDRGGLTLDQRRVLLTLIKRRAILSSESPQLWNLLNENIEIIRGRLHDLMLDVQIDAAARVAYKVQVAEDGLEVPKLLTDHAYNREDTIGMVYLRQRRRSERLSGAETVIIDRDDILGHVAAHRPADSTDAAGDAKKTNAAIDRMVASGVLGRTSDADRFEITELVDVLMTLERLRELEAWLKTENSGGEEAEPKTNRDADEVTDEMASPRQDTRT